jgi:hypothetical protein
MKEQKPLRPGSGDPSVSGLRTGEAKNGTGNGANEVADQGPPGSAPPEQRPPRPELTMHMDVNTRKNKGRLNRQTLTILGKTLSDFYDDVRKEGVPDRFKDLLQQLEGREHEGAADRFDGLVQQSDERKDKESD